MAGSLNSTMNRLNLKNSKVAERLFYLLCGTLLAFFTYKTVHSSIWAGSDYDMHYKFAGELSKLRELSVREFLQHVENSKILSYPIWHIFCYILSRVVKPSTEAEVNFVIAFITTLFEILAYVACVYGIKKVISGNCSYLFAGVGSLAVLLMGPLKILYVNENYYLGQITANPWHNPTTIAVKAASVMCFVLYVQIFKEQFTEEKVVKNGKIILVSCILAVSSFLKPSFYQMFVPGLAFACFVELIRTKGKAFNFCLKMFASVIPIMIVAVIQMQLSFAEQGNSIGIGLFTVIKLFSNHPLLSIIISIPFPLYIMILSYKDLIRDKKMLLAGSAFLSGIMQYILFYQTMDASAGNFAWGAYLGMGILNFATVCKFYEKRKEWSPATVCMGILLLAAQVVCGLLYMKNIVVTGSYI